MSLRVVLDTNVLISGLLFRGPPNVILHHALEGTFQLFVSADLLDELARVLSGKFPHRLEAIQHTLHALQELAIAIVPKEPVNVIRVDPSDNRILECALCAQADVIVSGDHHLLDLRSFRDIPILTPQAFLALHHPRLGPAP